MLQLLSLVILIGSVPNENNSINVLSYGINQIRMNSSIHAEFNALQKLNPLRIKKKLCKINLLVIRLSPKNKLQQSKPCSNCINLMNSYPMKIGYKIQNVFYSDENGCIVKTNLKNLKNVHVSKFHKKINTIDWT